ncbi:transposase [Geobacillus thermodenitrificans]|uniref:transposase n=1 Tax=Geobacillus thermodenitrificans TaxID=33940 RepID=UPI002DF74125|nr:transposase [Geobacillus thermodenitrificans]
MAKGDPDRLIVLVLDNARIHHAKRVREFLRGEGQCVHFIPLPPYSPQRNPIERLWKWLKDIVIANVFHKDRNDIAQAIARLVDYTRGNAATPGMCSVIEK